eukprot:1160229-Pelagomonas_calceolata.AAC.6
MKGRQVGEDHSPGWPGMRKRHSCNWQRARHSSEETGLKPLVTEKGAPCTPSRLHTEASPLANACV